jgi:hypothetical protein
MFSTMTFIVAAGVAVTGGQVGDYFSSFSTSWLPAGALAGTLAGTVDGQNGWTTRDAFTSSTTVGKWDQQVMEVNSAKVFRMSNALQVAGATFSSQVFSATSGQVAGEANAALWNNRGTSGSSPLSPTQFGAYAASDTFYSKVVFRSATGAAQTSLSLTLSASAKQSSVRMTWLNIQDTGSGFNVNFIDTGADGAFPAPTTIASGLSYTALHTLEMGITFVDGVSTVGGQVFGNDIVQIWLDGVRIHVGTTWESYFYATASERNAIGTPNAPRLQAVNSMHFRSTPAIAGNSGNGFHFKDFAIGNVY